jgi:hypothetical protein
MTGTHVGDHEVGARSRARERLRPSAARTTRWPALARDERFAVRVVVVGDGIVAISELTIYAQCRAGACSSTRTHP